MLALEALPRESVGVLRDDGFDFLERQAGDVAGNRPFECGRGGRELERAVDVVAGEAARDAATVFGFEGDHRQLAHKLGSKFDFSTVVVTRGKQGALAWHDNVVHDHDAYETDTVSPIGAGDAFTGAFLARRLAGDDVHRSLEFATAAAALKRTIPGDIARLTLEEVEAVVTEDADRLSR